MLRLLAGALLAMGVLQVALLLLARALGRPLARGPLLLGWALPLLLLAPWLPGRQILAPTNILAEAIPAFAGPRLPTPQAILNDSVYQFLPWELEVRHALAAGRLPLWSERLDGGSSPWSNPQAQVLSPLAVLARAVPIQHFLLVTLLLKVLAASQGTWLLARRLGARSPAALVGGACFALGGGILPWGLFPHSATAAWAPWVVAGVLAAARDARAARVVALALATAALLLSGHPETALFVVAAALLVAAGARRRRDGLRWLVRAGAGGAIGFALAAPHLLPFVAAAGRSLRAFERLAAPLPPFVPGPHGDWFAGGGWRYVLAPWSAHVFGVPYAEAFRGPWGWPLALSAFTGMAATTGAAAALLARGTRCRVALPLLAGWAASLVLAARFLPLEALLARIPLARVPEVSRALPVGCLLLAVAAALGWDALRRAPGRAATGSRRVASRAAALVVLALGLALSPDAAVALVAALVATAVALPARRARAAWAALALAVLVDLVPWGRAQLPAGSPASFYPRTAYLDRLGAVAAEPGGPWRVTGEYLTLYPSLLTVYGLDELRPHNPLAPRAQLAALDAAFGFAPDSERYFCPFGNVEHPLLDFLGVRAVATTQYEPARRRLEDATTAPAGASAASGAAARASAALAATTAQPFGPYRIFRNPQALPRWFLPAVVVRVPRAATRAWIRDLRDGRTVAVAADEAAGWAPAPRAFDAAAVRVLAAAPGHVTLAVAGAGAARLLATSEPGPDGWRARGPRGPLRTLTVNGAFVGVRVPADVDTVELRYVPPGLLAGSALAALGLVALVALAVVARRGRLLAPPPAPRTPRAAG